MRECPDLNQDGKVDFADFLILSADFGKVSEEASPLAADINNSGEVDFVDFLLLFTNFGKSIPLDPFSEP